MRYVKKLQKKIDKLERKVAAIQSKCAHPLYWRSVSRNFQEKKIGHHCTLCNAQWHGAMDEFGREK